MVKRTACNAGDPVLIPRWGRSPGGGYDNPLQYSCVENPHGERSLAGYSSWGHKESVGTIEWLILSLSFMAPRFSSIFTPYVSISKKYCVLSLYFLFILNSISWNAHNGLCVLYNGVLILISFFFFPSQNNYERFLSSGQNHTLNCGLFDDALFFTLPILAHSFICCCCCYSITKWCLTLHDPMDCSMPGFPVPPYLLEFAQVHVHWGDIEELLIPQQTLICFLSL